MFSSKKLQNCSTDSFLVVVHLGETHGDLATLRRQKRAEQPRPKRTEAENCGYQIGFFGGRKLIIHIHQALHSFIKNLDLSTT